MTSALKKINEVVDAYDKIAETSSAMSDVHQAAEDCIDKIRDILESVGDGGDEVNLNNPIAQLHERAQAEGKEPPEFKFSQSGESHTPTFDCECRFAGKVGNAKGKNKQTAKRRAAGLVLERVLGIRKD